VEVKEYLASCFAEEACQFIRQHENHPFLLYIPFLHGQVRFAFLTSELFLYLFSINFFMYAYYFFMNRSSVGKTRQVVIFGAGKAGIKLESEYLHREYKVKYFVDDDKIIQGRSIDAVVVLSRDKLKERLKSKKADLLVIAIPSASKKEIREIYEELSDFFSEVRILPSIDDILAEKDPTQQAYEVQSLSGKPGDVSQGFHTPEVVELVVVPEELGYVVEVENLGSVYNIARGKVTRSKVHVSDWLNLTRLPDEKSERGEHAMVVYEFEYDGKKWILRYDPGSDETFAAVRIHPSQ